jgi:hypothetical protein
VFVSSGARTGAGGVDTWSFDVCVYNTSVYSVFVVDAVTGDGMRSGAVEASVGASASSSEAARAWTSLYAGEFGHHLAFNVTVPYTDAELSALAASSSRAARPEPPPGPPAVDASAAKLAAPALSVSRVSAAPMAEGGAPVYISLRLASEPSEAVTISMNLLDTSQTGYDRRDTIELGFRPMTNATTSDGEHLARRVSRRALLQQLVPTFTTVATTGDAASGYLKYRGAAAVGYKLYFAPHYQNNVGVLDTTTNVFTTVATTGDAASGNCKYWGAVTVGDTVYFAPYAQSNVGVLDTTTNVFTTVATTGDAASGTYKYAGAAAVGVKVFFAPYNQYNVGVLDTTTNVFTTIATTGHASYIYANTWKYSGAAAVGDKVYFAPYAQSNVGVLDTTTNVFTTVATTGDAASGYLKYRGAAAVGANVYFAPHRQNNVGILATNYVSPSPPPPPPSPPPLPPPPAAWRAGGSTTALITVQPKDWQLPIVMRFRMLEDDVVDTKGTILHTVQYGYYLSAPTAYSTTVGTVDNDVPRLVLKVPRAPLGRLPAGSSATYGKHVFQNHAPYAITLYEPSTVLGELQEVTASSRNAAALVYASLDKRIRAQTMMTVGYVAYAEGKQVQISGPQVAFPAMEAPGTWHVFSVYADQDATLKGTYTESLKVDFASEIDAASCAGTPSLCGDGVAALDVEVVEHSTPGVLVTDPNADVQAGWDCTS